MIRPTLSSFTRSTALALACLFGSVGIASAADPIYDLKGAQPGRDYFSSLPFEKVDTISGNVIFTYTDLHVPGDAGMDLDIVRTYNSQDGKWYVGVAGAPRKLGFRLPGFDLSDVDLVMPDGGVLRANAGANTTVTLRNFWRFDKTNAHLEMPNGRVAIYDKHITGDGLYLTSLEDAFGNSISLEYLNGNADISRVWQHVTATWGIENRLVIFDTWIDGVPLGFNYNSHWWTYDWISTPSSPSNLRVLQNFNTPVGRAWSYTYTTDANGMAKVASVRTPNGGTVTYAWTTENFPNATPSTRVVIGSRTTGGNVTAGTWSFDWQNNGNRLVVTTPINMLTYETTTTNTNGEPMGGTTTLADIYGNVAETETQTYDVLQGPDGPFVVPKTRTIVRGAATYTTTNTYSGSNYGDYGRPNQIQESGEMNRTTSISYRHSFNGHYIRGVPESVTVGSGTTRSMTYGDDGFLTSVTQFGRTTTYSGNHGNVMDIGDPLGRHTTMTYHLGVVKSVQTPSGIVTTRTINDDSTVASETVAGRTTNFGYDAIGRVTSVAVSGLPTQTTAYTMSGGNLIQTTAARGGSSVVTDLDGFGRPLHTTDAAGVQTRVAYDAAGRQTYASYAYGGAVGEIGVTTMYDTFSRPGMIMRPDGSSTIYAYLDSGRQIRTTTRVSPTEARVTDAWMEFWGTPGDGRINAFKDASGLTWGYQYDGFGNMVRLYAPGGVLSRTWNYDWRNLLVSETHPESGTTSYTYDAAGQRIGKQDARGAAYAVSFSYDVDGRQTFVNAPGTLDDVATTYNAFGPVTITNGTSQTAFGYDGVGRVITRTDVIAGRTFAQTFEYDLNDHLATHTYPITGRKVMYTYGAQDHVTAVTTQVGAGPVTTLASNFVYHPPGTTASFQYGNGLTQTTTYDARSRPIGLSSGPLSQTYTYDEIGNVRGITDARSGYSSTYSYDALDRLTNVSGYGPATFTYDTFGNRLTKSGVTYTYDAGNHLTSLTGGATAFQYDAAGNMTTDAEGSTFAYNGVSQLKTANVFGATTTYRYGGDGARNMRVTSTGAEQFFVRAGSSLIGEYQAAGLDLSVTREYVNFGGALLASFAPSPVTAPATSVAITNPTLGQVIPQAQSLNLTATATPASGLTVTRVEYYLDGLFVGQATTAPYTVPFINAIITPGLHTFLARVVTSDGRAVSSPPVHVTTQ